ncbi:MAG TPA: hypothetical protein VIM96_11205 [Pseudomonadales bacterium]|jgi:hypothetical protein
MKMFSKPKALASTPFSDFIRSASSASKKHIYSEVLKKATERQNAIVNQGGLATAE